MSKPMEGTPTVVPRSTIVAAKRGEQDAVVVLWRTYQPQILRFLRAIHAPAPEDVASQVWIDVGRTLDRFVGDGDSFRRWIFTIARNRSKDEARRVSRRREVLDDHRVERSGACGSFDQFEGVSSLENALDTLRALPPDMAEAVMLRVVYEIPVDEVARLMERSQGSVRVLVHRGLHRLGAMLAPSELVAR